MALSRAAAAAARKAAKSRGLQGNRGKDGSLTRADDLEHSSGDPRYTVEPDTDQLNFYEGLAQEMSDTQLKKAHTQAADEVAELTALGTQMQEKNWLGVDMEKYQKEMSTAKQKLKAFEEELDLRESFEGEFTKRKRKFT